PGQPALVPHHAGARQGPAAGQAEAEGKLDGLSGRVTASGTMPKKLPPPWQQVDTRVIFQHPRLTVWEDTVVLPTGEQTQGMHFREAPDFVKVVCVTERRQVLLVYSYASPPRQVVHEFPGGIVNPGESPTDAARRELVEEVGLYPLHLRAVGTFLDNT